MDIRTAQPQDVQQVVRVHQHAFPGFFLTILGPGFLRQLYLGYLSHPESQLLCAYDANHRVMGFVAFSTNLSGLYRELLRRRLPQFAWYALCAAVRTPRDTARLFRALLKPGESERKEKYAELASLGVSPDFGGRGIGKALVHRVQASIDYGAFSYLKLETDAVDNDPVNAFYEKCGFVLHHRYRTPEGREMNEYRYAPSGEHPIS